MVLTKKNDVLWFPNNRTVSNNRTWRKISLRTIKEQSPIIVQGVVEKYKKALSSWLFMVRGCINMKSKHSKIKTF